jgi:ADP-ribose pyrophosphatase YjhB (NUDIX family)
VSLNPALQDVKFCPRCGAEATIDFPRSIRCAGCGYAAFYNPKPVACTIPTTKDGHLILLRRGFEPHKGRWSMPGGFVDLGESVEQAAIRETREEIGIDVELTGLVGVYSRSDDRIVVVVYAARAQGTPTATEEALEVRAFAPAEIPWHQLAFWSDGRALRDSSSLAEASAAAPSSTSPATLSSSSPS